MKSETPRTDTLVVRLKITPEYIKDKESDRDNALYLCRELERELAAAWKKGMNDAADIAEAYDNESLHGNDTMTKQNIASEIRAAAMPNEKS